MNFLHCIVESMCITFFKAVYAFTHYNLTQKVKAKDSLYESKAKLLGFCTDVPYLQYFIENLSSKKFQIFIFSFRDRFPYFKAEDERWKNSVRHNLSMNPHFRKGNKAKHGSGHLWVLADIEEDQTVQKIIQEVNAAAAASAAASAAATADTTAVIAAAPSTLASNSNVQLMEVEDEAAKAVRSILGHTDRLQASAEEPTVKILKSTNQNRASLDQEANKENSEAKRIATNPVTSNNNVPPPRLRQCSAKRPGTNLEIQSESSTKLDAPGMLCNKLRFKFIKKKRKGNHNWKIYASTGQWTLYTNTYTYGSEKS